MSTEQLLDVYYGGLARRSGWEDAIADDFAFTGGSPGSASRGKAAYREAMHRFSRRFETVSVKQSIVQDNTACVIATYALVSPSGRKATMDIAEVWEARGGQLASLAIHFDTATWKAFMAA